MIATAKVDRHRKWTPAELAILKDCYLTSGARMVAEAIGRSEGTVMQMARRIGISKPYRLWTPDEDAYMRKHYREDGVLATSAALKREPPATVARAKILGCSRRHCRRWSDDELDVVRTLYPQTSAKDIASRIGRSPEAVAGAAHRLGVTTNPNYRKRLSGRVFSEIHRARSSATRISRGLSVPESAMRKSHSPECLAKRGNAIAAAKRLRQQRKTENELRQFGQYITTNAGRLIMESVAVQNNGMLAGNEDVMQSSDGSWLLAELQKSFDTSVQHIVRMAAIVRRLDELGVQIELESSVLPYLRKIAHGNLSPDLFVTMQGHKSMLNIASTLPAPVQQQIAKNEPIKVMELSGDHRMVRPLEMTTKEVNQVFKFGQLRSDTEQVGYLRGKLQEKAVPEPTGEIIHIDRKRKGVVVGKTFISLPELKSFVEALTKKK